MLKYRSIHFAAYKGDAEEVAEWLEKDPSLVHAVDNRGDAPLYRATTVEVARLLLEHGADVNAQNMGGQTALQYAAISNHMEVARFLVDQGADVNAGEALIEALTYGHLDIAALLLEAGADANIVESYEGNTPLHTIMKLSQTGWTRSYVHTLADIVQKLIDQGANLGARNQNGDTPYHVAKQKHAFEDVLTILKRTMDLLDDPFPPLPGPPQSERIHMHPFRQEAVTILRYSGLARWSLDGEKRLLVRAQTVLPHFRHLAISPDGELIAIASADTLELRRWDDLTLVAQIALPGSKSSQDLAFSPDGRWLAFSVDGRVHLIERATGQIVAHLDAAGRHTWIAFDPSSRWLAFAEGAHEHNVCVYHIGLTTHAPLLKRAWNNPEPEEARWEARGQIDSDTAEGLDKDVYRPPLFLVHAAISPDSRWLAYFGTHEYPPPDSLGELILHSLESGDMLWHTSLDIEAIGEERLFWRDYFDRRNHTEVLFINNTELVCGVTGGTLLFYDVMSGMLLRRYYFDTDEDILSLALDHISSTLWVVLSNGELASVRLPIS